MEMGIIQIFVTGYLVGSATWAIMNEKHTQNALFSIPASVLLVVLYAYGGFFTEWNWANTVWLVMYSAGVVIVIQRHGRTIPTAPSATVIGLGILFGLLYAGGFYG